MPQKDVGLWLGSVVNLSSMTPAEKDSVAGAVMREIQGNSVVRTAIQKAAQQALAQARQTRH